MLEQLGPSCAYANFVLFAVGIRVESRSAGAPIRIRYVVEAE